MTHDELFEYIADILTPTVLLCPIGKGPEIQAAVDEKAPMPDLWEVRESKHVPDDQLYAFRSPKRVL
jgi:hypothetical protein